jgi:sugar lactone lactonase YvrE
MRVTERRIGVIGVLTMAAVTGLGAQTLPYKLVENWGALPGGEAWGEVTGVEIDRTGTIIAVRRSEPPVVELDASGKVLKTWGQGMFVWPHGFRIDRDGNLWVTDGRAEGGKGQQVFKLARDGRVLLTLGTKGVGGETPSTFDGPCDVAIGENGAIFVADGHRNNRVVKFSKDGTFVKAWGSKGEGPGQFQTPHAIAIDSRGRLFVADRGNRRIQIFDQDGKFLDAWPQFGRPSGILITADDTMYVADIQDKPGIVVGSARDGSVRGVIEGTLPESVAVARDGAVYAGETTTGRTIRKFVK